MPAPAATSATASPSARPSIFHRLSQRVSTTLTVRQLMTSDVMVCQKTDACSDVAERMRQGNVGMLPVLEGGTVVGVVTDRDLALRHLAPGATLPAHANVGGCMTPNVVSVTPETKLDEAVEKMRTRQVRRLLVMDSKNSLQGVLTLDDIFVEAGRSAEVGRVVQSALAVARPPPH